MSIFDIPDRGVSRGGGCQKLSSEKFFNWLRVVHKERPQKNTIFDPSSENFHREIFFFPKSVQIFYPPSPQKVGRIYQRPPRVFWEKKFQPPPPKIFCPYKNFWNSPPSKKFWIRPWFLIYCFNIHKNAPQSFISKDS